MTGKLSERFSQLQNSNSNNNKNTAANSNSSDRNRGKRVQQRAAQQTEKRGAQTAARRGLILPTTKAEKPSKGAVKANQKTAGRINKPKIATKGKKGPKGRKGEKGDKKPREKKASPSSSDLDMDMDTYWFKAGKGPDPRLAALDKDLDDYSNAKAVAPVNN